MNLKLPFEPKILAYSTSWVNNPIMTVLVPVPTVKLAELRTHRLFHQFDGEVYELATNDQSISCNANSSRAIPIQKQVDSCLKNPFIPIWTKNQKGMQGEVFNEKDTMDWPNMSGNIETIKGLTQIWMDSLKGDMLDGNMGIQDYVNEMIERGVHKQDASLLLNPFSWTTCVLSGDKAAWENWFDLRCPAYCYEGQNSKIKRLYKSKRKWLEDKSWNFTNDPSFEKTPESESEWDFTNKSMTYPAIQVIAEKLFDLWTYETPVHLEEGQWHAAFVDGYFLKTCQDTEITRFIF